MVEDNQAGMENEAEERTTPDAETDFSALLIDYGIKEKKAVVIAKHIADTGDATVFDDPVQLLEKLARLPREIAPVSRKAILDHWIAQRNIPVPERYEEDADKPAEELRKRRPSPEEAKKYVVDDDGGISVATKDERPALDWAEAEKLASRRKKEASERRKQESAGEAKEPPFIVSEGGEWALNPQAKLTAQDIMIWESWKAARARGGEMDPIEFAAALGEKFKILRELVVGDREVGGARDRSLVDDIKDLRDLGILGAEDKGTKRS